MSFNLIVQRAEPLSMGDLAALAVLVDAPTIEVLPDTAWRCLNANAEASVREEVRELAAQLQCDWAFVEAGRDLSSFGLWMTDMDSTLIEIECIDEIAALLGIKDQVAAITERSMAGELDFAESLTQRVALLAGLKETSLRHVYDSKVTLTSGTETLVAACKAAGVKIGLISGGFTHFTDRLKAQLGLDYAIANTLEVKEGRLTGRLVGEIIDAQAKADWLIKLRDQLGLTAAQTFATGDGANDLKMLEVAGVGIAFHAKPIVCHQADMALSYVGLDGVVRLFAKA